MNTQPTGNSMLMVTCLVLDAQREAAWEKEASELEMKEAERSQEQSQVQYFLFISTSS